jgi:hypothetical protein
VPTSLFPPQTNERASWLHVFLRLALRAALAAEVVAPSLKKPTSRKGKNDRISNRFPHFGTGHDGTRIERGRPEAAKRKAARRRLFKFELREGQARRS